MDRDVHVGAPPVMAAPSFLPPQHVPYPSGVAQSFDVLGAGPVSGLARIGTLLATPSGFVPAASCGPTPRAATVRISVPATIDVFEVGYGRYRACVTAGACTTPPLDPLDPLKLDWDDFRRAWIPVGNLTRGEMAAFCAFDHGRLPTLAELSAAAQGGDVPALGPAKLIGVATDCWAPWGTKADAARCGRIERQVWTSPAYRRAEFRLQPETILTWDGDDIVGAGGQDACCVAAQLFGGLAERTSTPLDLAVFCDHKDGDDDIPPDSAAASHAVYSPADDLKRAFTDGSMAVSPVAIADDVRSYKLGFRCAH